MAYELLVCVLILICLYTNEKDFMILFAVLWTEARLERVIKEGDKHNDKT